MALAGARVHREGDVEAGHVVGDVRVEVEEHRARRAHDLGDAGHGVAVAAHQAGEDGAEVGEHLRNERCFLGYKLLYNKERLLTVVTPNALLMIDTQLSVYCV